VAADASLERQQQKKEEAIVGAGIPEPAGMSTQGDDFRTFLGDFVDSLSHPGLG
jgi:hypothetical protein